MRNDAISNEQEVEPEAASLFSKNSFLARELKGNAVFLCINLAGFCHWRVLPAFTYVGPNAWL